MTYQAMQQYRFFKRKYKSILQETVFDEFWIHKEHLKA